METQHLRELILRGDSDTIDRVCRYLNPIIQSEVVLRDDWEDVRQHCLVEICRYLEATHEVRNVWGLLRRITINSVIDFNRKARRAGRTFVQPEADDDEPGDRADRLRPVTPDALRRIAMEDEIRYIFNSISEVCRTLFHLLFIEDRSYEEAATELSISKGALRARLSRCRERASELRDRIV